MQLNTTLRFLSLKSINGVSPVFAHTHGTAQNTLMFSEINVKKSQSSFFFSSSSNFAAQIRRSTFKNFLQSAIKVTKDKYALLDTRTRVVFTRKANIFMNDCSFTSCQATGTGVDGHGGAICVFLGPDDLFAINLERVNFNKCLAKSSGGSIFSFNTKFVASVLCFSESFAAKNTLVYLQATKEITINCTYTANNKLIDEFNPCSNSIGCSSSILVFNEVNMSNTYTDIGAGYISAYRFKYFNLNHAIFEKCFSDYGLFMHSVGDLTALSHTCIFKNSTYNEKMLMQIDISITFYHCVFSLDGQGFVIDPEKPLITISSSYLEGPEEDWKERLKGIKFSDMHFTDDANSVTKLMLTDAQGSCRDHDKETQESVQANVDTEESKVKQTFKLLMRFFPSILGFIGGLTLIFYISRRRKKSFKAPSAFAR